MAKQIETVRDPRDPAVIRQEIERARAEIASSVVALREQVTQLTDWRGVVEKQPVPVIVGCFALGFWLGYRGE